ATARRAILSTSPSAWVAGGRPISRWTWVTSERRRCGAGWRCDSGSRAVCDSSIKSTPGLTSANGGWLPRAWAYQRRRLLTRRRRQHEPPSSTHGPCMLAPVERADYRRAARDWRPGRGDLGPTSAAGCLVHPRRDRG